MIKIVIKKFNCD